VLLRTIVAGALTLAAVPLWPLERVTEAEFVAPLDDQHPAGRALLERLGAAEAALARARLLANPRIEYGREQPEGGPRQTTVTLAWTPPIDGRRGLAVAAAKAGVAAAEADRLARLLRVRLTARQAFAEWSAAFERRRLLADHLRVVANLTRRTQLKALAGEESGLAAARIRLVEAEVGAALATAESGLARAEAAARAWRPELPPAAGPARPDVTGSDPAAVAPLSLDALRHEAEQARLEERLTRRFWAAPEVLAGWQRQEAAGAGPWGPVLGASWTIPLFDRNQPARREASRRREAAEARLALATTRSAALLAGAEAARRRLAEAAAAAHAAAAAVPLVVEGALASFDAGEATVTDLLDALRSAVEARTREVEMHAAALAAVRALEAAQAGLAVGEEP
jgi:outer membrane protein, heavy metal efflux system